METLQLLNIGYHNLAFNSLVAREKIASAISRETIGVFEKLAKQRQRQVDTLIDEFEQVMVSKNPKKHDPNTVRDLINFMERDFKIKQIINYINMVNPAYWYERRFNILDLRALRRILDGDENLFLFGLHGDYIYSTCIDKESFFPGQNPVDNTILPSFSLLQKSLSANHLPSNELDSTYPFKESYLLYTSFFSELDRCTQPEINHTILSPSELLLSLPFNALENTGEANNLTDANWFSDKYSFSVLPNVSSLEFIRSKNKDSNNNFAFLGVGYPNFRGDSSSSNIVVAQSLYSKRGGVNIDAIRRLPPLPDTETEILSIASLFGEASSKVLLHDEANEYQIRRSDLQKYNIISFATHALVKGEFDSIREPALVLTPRNKYSENDGLLTATEIASLKLNADLVLLSACNTAKGDGTFQANGLSGLADSFFMAGAKSLAVSQWSVYSSASRELSTRLISKIQRHDNNLAISKSLQESMQEYRKSGDTYLMHPRFWAPFYIAGDGNINLNSAGEQKNNVTFLKNWENIISHEGLSEWYNAQPVDSGGYILSGIETNISKNAERAASSFAKISPNGDIELKKTDEVVGDMKVFGATEEQLFTIGTSFSSANKTDIAIAKRKMSGEEEWIFEYQTPLYDLPGNIMITDDYVIIPFYEADFESKDLQSNQFIGLLYLSHEGQRAKLIRKKVESLFDTRSILVVERNGKLYLIENGEDFSFEIKDGEADLTTRFRGYCWKDVRARVYEVNNNGFDLINNLEGVKIVKQSDDYLLVETYEDCNPESDLAVYSSELLVSDNKIEPILKYEGPLYERPSGLVILDDGTFIVGGSIYTPYQINLGNEKFSPEESSTLLQEKRRNDTITVGFLAAFNKHGKLIGDIVLDDSLTRGINSIVKSFDSDNILVTGFAFGGDSWAAEYEYIH